MIYMYENLEVIDELKNYINDIRKLNSDPSLNQIALDEVILKVNLIKANIFKSTDLNNEKMVEVCEKIVLRENILSDDNLKYLFEELDKIQAEKNIEEEMSKAVVELEDDSDNEDDAAIKYLYSLSIKEDSIVVINSLSEYTSFISTLSQGYLSRGQKDYTFELLPSALRRVDGQLLYDSKEIRIMRDEFRISLKYFDNRFEHLNDLELEAYAQHYGIPTYLIDFTNAHFISLLFALEEYSYKQHAIIYFVDSTAFNAECTDNGGIIPNCSDLESCNGRGSCIFVKPNDVNSRIHFQKGYFLRVPENYKHSVINDIVKYTKIILIPQNVKIKILRELFSAGFTFQNIYHDIDNTVKSIKFRINMKKGEDNE